MWHIIYITKCPYACAHIIMYMFIYIYLYIHLRFHIYAYKHLHDTMVLLLFILLKQWCRGYNDVYHLIKMMTSPYPTRHSKAWRKRRKGREYRRKRRRRIYSKTSLTEHLHTSTNPLYRLIYLHPKQSPTQYHDLTP